MADKPTKKTSEKPSDVDGRFQLLLTLIALLKTARHKPKKTELEFMMVNQTFNMVQYRHCAYWERDKGEVQVKSVSGLVHVDPDGPYIQWLKKMIKGQVADYKKQLEDDEEVTDTSFCALYPVSKDQCSDSVAEDWQEWASEHGLLMIMKDRHGDVIAGLWLDREVAFTSLEVAMLEDLGDGYAHTLQRFVDDPNYKKSGFLKSVFTLSGSNMRKALLVLLLVMLLPVRTSVTGPAEVVAQSPLVVSVPYDGIIETVEVMPGDAVEQGDVLVRMDSTMLRNKAEVAVSDLLTAEIALRKTEREAFSDRTKLAELALLKAQLEQKSAEKDFASELLSRAEITADRSGVAIFSDPNALRGRPVQTGEQIMMLADPRESELLIRIPVSSIIEINKDVPAKFYLNVTPLGSREATYTSIGYQATPDPDGLMTYKLRATFKDGEELPRIGWTGTAKVYGDHTILAFNILRRPIVTLRRKLGL